MPARSRAWPDPRVKPPYGAAELDRGHSLAAGYVSGLLINEGSNRPTWTPSGGTPTVGNAPACQATVSGIGLTFNGTSDVVWWDKADLTSTAVIDSTVILGSIYGGTGLDKYAWAQASTTQANDRLAILYGGNVAGEIVIEYGDSNDGVRRLISAGTTYNDNNLHIIGHTVDKAASVIRLYIDGRPETGTGTLAGFNGNHPMNRTSLGALQAASTSLFSSATAVFVHQWLRLLTVAEHTWIAFEPYAMYRPIVRRRYFVPALEDSSSIYAGARMVVKVRAGRWG